MKKLFLILLIISLPIQFSHAVGVQAVADAGMSAISTAFGLEAVANYALIAKEYVDTAMRFEQQVKMWQREIDQYARAITNLRNVKDYRSFMDWYNRGIEAERHLKEFLDSPNIEIRGKHYNFREVEQMSKDVYGDLKWKDEISEQERYHLWTSLGLTPSNYLYVQTTRQKGINLSYEMLSRRGLQDSFAAQNLERLAYRNTEILGDQYALVFEQKPQKNSRF